MAQVQIRHSSPPADDDVFVIHMGAGSVDVAIAGAIRNHDEYIGLLDQRGRFTVSVFAAMAGVSVAAILEALPQGQYGRARFGDLRRHRVAHLATTILDPSHTPQMVNLQRVHFDLILPVPGIERSVAEVGPHELDVIRQRLHRPAANLLALFDPRQRK